MVRQSVRRRKKNGNGNGFHYQQSRRGSIITVRGRAQPDEETDYDDAFFKLNVWLLIVRFISVIFVTSEFVPDEYWQGTEVAHWIVTGKGYLTWEWSYGLRGFLYPCFLALPMWIMSKMQLVEPYLLVFGPRLFQAGVTFYAEYKFLQMIRSRFGNDSALEISQLFLTNWFLLYCGSRTLTNTMEMSLNLLAYTYLKPSSLSLFTMYAVLAFLVRPTAILMWIPIALIVLKKLFKKWAIFLSCFIAASALLCVNTFLDIHFYRRIEIPAWKFLQFNFLEGKSAEFGTHPHLWYFYSALPSILGLNFVWVILGSYSNSRKYRDHILISIGYLTIFSLLGHKEIRFLLPIVPHLLVVAGDFIWSINECRARASSVGILQSNCVSRLMLLNIVASIVATIFFSQFHQVGIKPATKLIVSDAQRSNLTSPNIWIMMPCYSVPVYSYFCNPNANFVFLTCSPPGLEYNSPDIQSVDFAKFDFYEFIGEKLKTGSPNYVLTYDNKSKGLKDIFKLFGIEFVTLEKYYHTVLPFDNVGKAVHVLKVI